MNLGWPQSGRRECMYSLLLCTKSRVYKCMQALRTFRKFSFYSHQSGKKKVPVRDSECKVNVKGVYSMLSGADVFLLFF